MKKIICAFSFLFIITSGCATAPQAGMEDKVISQSDYEKTLEQNSKNIESYNGLYNTINMTASLVRTQLAEAQLKQNARIFQWDPVRFQDESFKKMELLKKHTEVFVSFYTPEKKHDDLQKSQTLWKIFLDAGGKRFEGKATKIKLQASEVQAMYPYHTKFSTPYTIVFPVTASSLEGQEVKLTITGSVGSATVVF